MPSVRKETDITKLDHSIPALTTESAKENSEIIDAEEIVCSPAKKWAKIIDKEHIVMGEEFKKSRNQFSSTAS